MCDGKFEITLFRTAALLDPCRNCVSSPALTEKSFHSITARCDSWSIVTTDPFWLIVALPDTTVPPDGFAEAGRVGVKRVRTVRAALVRRDVFERKFACWFLGKPARAEKGTPEAGRVRGSTVPNLLGFLKESLVSPAVFMLSLV